MRPSFPAGTIAVIDEEAYRQASPQRGDLVLFESPPDPERLFIKRVIGLPNEQVEVRGGLLFINGALLEEPYIDQPPIYEGRWLLAEGEYFVLGDSRNNSSDSHNWGALPAEMIRGKVVSACERDDPATCSEVVGVAYNMEQ